MPIADALRQIHTLHKLMKSAELHKDIVTIRFNDVHHTNLLMNCSSGSLFDSR